MLYIYGLDISLDRMDSETKELYNNWVNARLNKDFSKADEYRIALTNKGIEL